MPSRPPVPITGASIVRIAPRRTAETCTRKPGGGGKPPPPQAFWCRRIAPRNRGAMQTLERLSVGPELNRFTFGHRNGHLAVVDFRLSIASRVLALLSRRLLAA